MKGFSIFIASIFVSKIALSSHIYDLGSATLPKSAVPQRINIDTGRQCPDSVRLVVSDGAAHVGRYYLNLENGRSQLVPVLRIRIRGNGAVNETPFVKVNTDRGYPLCIDSVSIEGRSPVLPLIRPAAEITVQGKFN